MQRQQPSPRAAVRMLTQHRRRSAEPSELRALVPLGESPLLWQLISLAAAALALHSVSVRWAELRSLSDFKNEGTGNWGPETRSELPKVSQLRAWLGLIWVQIPECCSFHTTITSKQSRRFCSLCVLCSKPQDICLPQARFKWLTIPQNGRTR